jgi:cytoskeletal protein CcmA (bactofilin family)
VAHAPESTRISHGISIRGEIVGRQDLVIDGELQGSIRLEGARVTVGTNGRLKADVAATEIIVEGQVNGNLTAHSRVLLRRTARVYGSVLAPRLAIEEGAVFNGEVEMAQPGEASSERQVGGVVSAFRAAAP